jgi:hypothetical protein
MKYICFSILGKTLCGKEDEPVPEHLADSRRLCNDCIQVMWREQYRRDITVRQEVPKVDIKKSTKRKVESPLEHKPKPTKTLRYYLTVKI